MIVASRSSGDLTHAPPIPARGGHRGGMRGAGGVLEGVVVVGGWKRSGDLAVLGFFDGLLSFILSRCSRIYIWSFDRSRGSE